MKLSTAPEERSPKIMWMKSTGSARNLSSAENGAILHWFYGPQLTGRKSEDCYTFEQFASIPAVIHNTCYCYY